MENEWCACGPGGHGRARQVRGMPFNSLLLFLQRSLRRRSSILLSQLRAGAAALRMSDPDFRQGYPFTV